jgi:hypothetical protein
MKFLLAFENTGDTIPFVSVNHEVLEYYHECITSKNLNKFSIPFEFGRSVVAGTRRLDDTIKKINKWIYELIDGEFSTYELEQYLDQAILNKYHSDWVESHSIEYNIIKKLKKYNSEQAKLIHSIYPDDIPRPKLNTVISKLGLRDEHEELNTCVHLLERIFHNEIECEMADEQWIEFDNPFSKKILTNDIANFKISPHLLGRTLYNKYANFDLDLECSDENNYDQLTNCVTIHLLQPQTIPLSKEYVAWCKKHNKVPSGGYLNIGDIVNLTEKLTEYRMIIVKNSLQKNNFSIQLNKG